MFRSGDRATRRDLLRPLSALAGVVLCSGQSTPDQPRIPETRLALLEELERRACLFFYEQAHPFTGLVLDRVAAGGRDTRRVASIAATGFGLSALVIADVRGYLPGGDARRRAERTLEFLAGRAYHRKGFYFHFLDAETGERAYGCELSSVDTAWLLCGVICARQHFGGARIRQFANQIIERVEWDWMLAGGPTLCHGWRPESGFLPYRWDQYCELLAMYLLAIGSNTHPIPASSWHAWDRPKRDLGPGQLYIESPAPLFAHQYSHAWLDLRRRRDEYADYHQNSKVATLLHRDFCLGLSDRFPWFSEDLWGITSSDSRYGYIEWGAPRPDSHARIDGTVVPCAAGGSLVFLPEECSRVLETMLDRYGAHAWTRYGFVDAFHPLDGWWCPDVIGIDLGIMLLMAENCRTQAIWTAMMSAPEVQRGFDAAGFSSFLPG